ncbi:MAG: LacI family DNA-binding transcriptional regulator [Chitinophagaceae bacterium]|nr:LacI family DNA-binding transcriptional regulator [Chitinophagaceae bacterium]
MKKKNITIIDIAKEINVSPSTVSRALNQNSKISQETIDLVKKKAEELNYTPNLIARGLRENKTNTIGVIIPEVVHFFFSSVLSGIEEVTKKYKYNVILTQSQEMFEKEVLNVNTLLSSHVDGFLISMAWHTLKTHHFENILKKNIPLVFFDRVCESIETHKVITDDRKGAYEATKHLIGQGCKSIVHLTSSDNLNVSIMRRNGYIDALKEYNIPIREDLIIAGKGEPFTDGEEQIQVLIDRKIHFDGIFAHNDLTALGAMGVLKQKNIKIPEEVAVVGYSDWQLSSFVEPSLSSVSQNGFEMGKKSAEILIQQIKKPTFFNPITEVIHTQLMIRKSSQKNN